MNTFDTALLKKASLSFSLMLILAMSGCFSSDSSSDRENGDDPDGDAPTVTATGPIDGALDVATNTKVIAKFSEPMAAAGFDTTSFTVAADGEAAVTGSVALSADGHAATFTADSDLGASTEYTATIAESVESQGGIAMAGEHSWVFTTGDSADTTAPTITATDPAEDALAVPLNRSVAVIFSESMDPTTVDGSSFTLNDSESASVAAEVSYLGTTATLTPDSLLQANTTYTAVVTTDVSDLAGNWMAMEKSWSFTTSETEAEGPSPVNLGTAGDYVILSKSAISTTGTTDIVGDIAVSPAAETFITGFSQTRDASDEFSTSAIVNGNIYAADMASPTPSKLTTAVGDMEIAYSDAAGRTTPDHTELGAGDISGMTLEPGLYSWSTGLLAASDVTLSGGANDVWIFQVAEDLTVESGVSITLSGGALPKNIFWQVAGSLTLGTTADFKGIVLCLTQVAVNTDAVINGRLLAQTAVTLDANAVTQPVE